MDRDISEIEEILSKFDDVEFTNLDDEVYNTLSLFCDMSLLDGMKAEFKNEFYEIRNKMVDLIESVRCVESVDIAKKKLDNLKYEKCIINLQPYSDDQEFENFKFMIAEEFEQHVNKKVIVKGKDLTWAKLTGSKEFYLIEPLDIVKELVPRDTDFTYRMEKVGKKKYKVESSNHDSTEYYDIEITDILPTYNDEEILSDELLT
jgi:hypothetical protein|tara:strand:- start:3504 stop:4115 length:612 start_codon:yes stop_codon:yes gene_type:complete